MLDRFQLAVPGDHYYAYSRHKRLAYNVVTAFQRNCLEESWQGLTLQKLRYTLFLLPGELTRPQNRPVLRLRESPVLQDLANDILRKLHRLRPIQL